MAKSTHSSHTLEVALLTAYWTTVLMLIGLEAWKQWTALRLALVALLGGKLLRRADRRGRRIVPLGHRESQVSEPGRRVRSLPRGCTRHVRSGVAGARIHVHADPRERPP